MRLNSLPLRYHCRASSYSRIPTLSHRPTLPLPKTPQDFWVPPLSHIRMTFHPIPQRGLAQRGRHPSTPKRKLDIIQPLATTSLERPSALFLDVLGHLSDANLFQIVKGGIAPHTLEKGNGKAGAFAGGRREHPVRGAHADALR